MSDLIDDLKFTMLPGSTFKELFGFMCFFKVTGDPEVEKLEFIIQDGLNEIQLTQKNGYVDGGIVFNQQWNLFKGLGNYTNMIKYIREVEIPDDAVVFIDHSSFRSDKLILKERKNISESDVWKDIEFCKEVLISDHRYLECIKNPSNELLNWLISKRPIAIELIDSPSDELVYKVLKDTPHMIRYIKNAKIEHYLHAFEQNKYAVKHIDIKKDMLDELIKIKPEIGLIRAENYQPLINKGDTYQVTYYNKPTITESQSEEFIRKDPNYIRHVTNQTQKLCDLAFFLNPLSFKYFEPKFITDQMCNDAVSHNNKMLTYVPGDNILTMDQTIIINALLQDGSLIEHIYDPSYEMCKAAVTSKPDAIYQIRDKPQDLIAMLAEKDPKYFQLFDEINIDNKEELTKLIAKYPMLYSKLKHKTQDLSNLAVSKIPSMLQYVPKEYQTEEMCIAVINNHPAMLQYVFNQTPEICKHAVCILGSCLKYIKDPKNKTEELCRQAISNDPFAIEFVDNQTEEMCLSALEKDIRVMDNIHVMTERILAYVVMKKPELIKQAFEFCPHLVTEDLVSCAVYENGLLLKFIPTDFKTEKVCEIAIFSDPNALEYVPYDRRTRPLLLSAVCGNGNVIRFIEDPPVTLCIEAVKDQPNALRYISNQTHEMCMIALKKDILSFEYIKNKTAELCFYAVSKNPAVMSCIDTKDVYIYNFCVLVNPKVLHYIRDVDRRHDCSELLVELQNIILSE